MGDHRAAARASALALGQFCVVVVFQSTTIALPVLGDSFHLTPTGVSWVVGITALAFGGLLPAAGGAADRWGAARVFRVGTAVLAASSLLAASAPTVAVLLVARLLQGAAMAGYTPAMVALLHQGFADDRERRRALVWWNLAGGLGGAVAVVGGGALTQWWGWRVVFLLAGVAAVATALAGMVLPATPARRDADPFHPTGPLLTSLAAAGLVFALASLQTRGADPVTLTWVAAAAVLAALWWWRERRASRPVVPRSLRHRRTLQPVLVAALHGVAINTPMVFYTLFAQHQLHATTLLIGIAFLPCNVGLVIGSALGGWLDRRHGPRPTTIAGLAAVAAGVAVLTTISPTSTLWRPFALGFLLYGAGANIAQVGFLALAGRRAPDHERGTLAGLVTGAGQLATAGGLALLTGIAHLVPDAVTGTRLAFGGATAFAVLGALAALPRTGDASPAPGSQP